ncbi:MAG TPA: YncE family protein [Longimicrobiales bacterium]|nr:YncE family protein [Longimicrobiales bacterium]
MRGINRLALLAAAGVAAGGCRDAGPAGYDAAPANENIYAFAGANELAPAAARARPLVYVPNSRSGTISVIDPATYRVLRTFHTGSVPQHVVPAYDLTRLWVLNNESGTVTPIDPVTGRAGPSVAVDDPYNMYYTPDGRFAIVLAERLRRLDFLDPHTLRLVRSFPTACDGVDHVEFTTEGRYLIATCEFAGSLMKVDLAGPNVVGYLPLRRGWLRGKGMPQDIRAAPDGRTFYVADMKAGGVDLIDPVAFRRIGFIRTGPGTHGLYPSRDGRLLYVTNRGWSTLKAGPHGPGSVSVVDPKTRRVVATWPVPGGGSPDMGGVTADGRELWVSGRYDRQVYVFDTASGRLTHRIPVGREPHGLCVWPQPGRFSLGHTGNMR